jgi:hypothetical protein
MARSLTLKQHFEDAELRVQWAQRSLDRQRERPSLRWSEPTGTWQEQTREATPRMWASRLPHGAFPVRLGSRGVACGTGRHVPEAPGEALIIVKGTSWPHRRCRSFLSGPFAVGLLDRAPAARRIGGSAAGRLDQHQCRSNGVCWRSWTRRPQRQSSSPSPRSWKRAACGPPRQADRLGNLCKCRGYWRLS